MLPNSKYLRVSITNKCNLACFYCHQEGYIEHNCVELSPREIQFACKVALSEGYNKFKISGGEPTYRNDICSVIKLLSDLDLPDLSMITNGTKLNELSTELWECGLRRINVTLNTINEERFKLFQKDNSISLKDIITGIDKAVSVGYRNMKLNFIYFEEECDRDLSELLSFSKFYGTTLVVLPVIGSNYFSLDYLHNKLKSYGIFSEEIIKDNEGIKRFFITMVSGAHVILRCEELHDIKPYIFCNDCDNRVSCREGIFPIRLSADGEIILCLANNEHHINIRNILKEKDEKALKKVFNKIRTYETSSFVGQNIK